MFGKNDSKTESERPTIAPTPTPTRSTKNNPSNNDGTITAYLGPDVSIEGTLRFEHSVLIEGQFKGTIESDGQLVIGENAEVDADVQSRHVSIKGTLRGTVNATERVQVQGNATVLGDITTPSLQMDETVTFEGKCSTGKPVGKSKKDQQKRETERAEQSKEEILDAVESVKA